MVAFATVEEYRLDSGDEATSDDRVQAVLEQQSAKLRAKAAMSEGRTLTSDQAALARLLVTDAARKALVVPSAFEGMESAGVKQSSFSANGFQGSVTYSNPSGTAYFDRDTLKALKASLHGGQRLGYVYPC